MLKIKYDINQQDLKTVTSILLNLNNFHSLGVVDRVSETQFQGGENSNCIILRLKVPHIFGFSFFISTTF